MATMGTAEFAVRVDPSRVLAVVRAVEMLRDLLIGYGHEWTPEQLAALDAVAEACEPKHLAADPDPEQPGLRAWRPERRG